ncbi:hypothetical protein [Polyangium jinanense]|uniref:Uncharacterized protein n=1 Tax=Polyangium jinanense TaxID=2829994 RepID=A0A9X3XEE0_9BACT|nr:hypothetical protein [Polyangium jinanense]MDC3962333.1 hypothetical protein [Polyangium jinanense]MDC3989094.1 hypothetical protein [Polyangium jinanense]
MNRNDAATRASRAILLALRVSLLAAGPLAISTYAGAAHAEEPAGSAVVLVVEGLPWDVDPEAVRAAIGREIGKPVVLSGAAPAGKASFVLRGEGGRRVTLTYRAGGEGASVGRTIDLPDDPDRTAETLALLAGNLARDEAAELAALLGKRPEDNPAAAPSEAEAPREAPSDAPVEPPPVAETNEPPAQEPPAKAAPPENPHAPRKAAPAPVSAPAAGPPATPTRTPSLEELAPCWRHDATQFFAGANVLPRVGMSTSRGSNVVHNVSANFLAGYATGLDGLEVGLGLNIEREFACGVQLTAVANIVAGPVRGVQAASGFNFASSLRGVQLGAIDIAAGPVFGMQMGALGIAGDVVGAQIGALNIAGGAVSGVQMGAVNVAAGPVKGVQLGLVNYADRSTLSFGLLNIIRRGRLHIDLWGQETGIVMAGIEHGGDYMHNIYGIGTRLVGTERRLALTLGLGGHVQISKRFSVDLDLLGYSLHETPSLAPTAYLAQVRAVAALEIGARLGVFAGPSYTVVNARSVEDALLAPYDSSGLNPTNANPILGWPGLTIGLRMF